MKLTEQKAAELLEAMDMLLGENGFKTVQEKIAALQATVEPLKGLDPRAIAEEQEKLRAAQSRVEKHLRTKRDPFYISGIEDLGDQFSIVRALAGYFKDRGSRKGFEDVGAGLEFELLKQATQRRRDLYAKAGIGVGDDSSAATFIPDQVIPDVIGAMYRRAIFVNLQGDGTTRVSVVDGIISGGEVRVPRFDGGMIGYWIDEEDAFTESFVKSGLKRATPHKLGVLAKLTREMEEGQGYGFETLFRNDLVQAAKKKLDHAIAFGTGGNSPRGITRWPGVRVFSAEAGEAVDDMFIGDVDPMGVAAGTLLSAANGGDWQGAELNFDGLMDLQNLMEEDDVTLDVVTTASKATYFKRLKQLKVQNYDTQATMMPYLLGVPMLTDARLRDLIGDFAKSSMFTAHVPGATLGVPTTSVDAKFTDVIVADLSAMLLLRWAGLEIEDDSGTGVGFTKDYKLVKLRMRADTFIREERKFMVCPDARVLS